MAKQYYVKKAPNTNGADIEWTSLTGREFYHLTTSPEGKGRFFIDMDDFMIEASKEEYIEWRREKDHSDYLREQEDGHPVLSLYSGGIADDRNGEEFVSDESVDVEENVLRALDCKALRSALDSLDSKSYSLIHALYFNEKGISERTLAVKLGVPQSTINKRKNKILKNLKFLVVKSKKSSQ